jgi:hypothetical protein
MGPGSRPGRRGWVFANETTRSRGAMRPSFACTSALSNKRTQGMPDARCTRGLVCKLCEKLRTRAYRSAEALRHSLRNGFTAYIVLSPVGPGSLSPSLRRNESTQLDASIGASGPHDFTVRIRAVRYRRLRVHRNPSHVHDDHDTPSRWDGMAIDLKRVGSGEKRNIFDPRA